MGSNQKSLQELGLTQGLLGHAPDVMVNGICVDSRECKPGDLFAALPGSLRHGAEFIQYAVRMDAACILTDQDGLEFTQNQGLELDVPVYVSENPRRDLALAAARFYAKQPPTMIAVTGTNGKTSIAHFTRQIWEHLGLNAVNFGTAGVEGYVSEALSHTTPEPITLHKLLARLSDAGVTHGAMEASSHGLEQNRLDGVYLTAAGFSNFSQDHLDYHKTFEAYFDAKAGLFGRVLPPEGSAVVNVDDPKGAALVHLAQSRGQDVLTVGSANCDIALLNQTFDATGQTIRFSFKDEIMSSRLSLIGGFQAQNVLVAAGLAIASGSEHGKVFDSLSELTTVTGRMDLAATRQNGSSVFVDYAHTPDAVATALQALRPHVMGRVLAVIGAGGDRDKQKRALMGQAAAQHADVVFVTDDNPRTEDPAEIRQAIMQGCPEATEIADRAQAILAAVDALQPGDALLIAGKGHETGQMIGDDVLPFNDAEQASISVEALDGLL